MGLSIKRLDGQEIQVLNGSMRLKVMIELQGSAEIPDPSGSGTLMVGVDADGNLVELPKNYLH